MTRDYLEKKLDEIKHWALIQDDEKAHLAEKSLWEDALTYIATEPPGCDSAYLAKEVLKTKEIKFSRWFA